jgi:hypothetical protein
LRPRLAECIMTVTGAILAALIVIAGIVLAVKLH